MNAANAKWNANDSFFWNESKVNVRLGAAFATIDLNGQTGCTINVKNNLSIVSLIDSSGKGQTANLVVKNNKILTLGGNAGLDANGDAQAAGVFNGLGDITLGSAGTADCTLNVKINAALDGRIDSKADGIVNIFAGKTLTLNGVVGGNTGLAEINLVGKNSVVVFNEDVMVDRIETRHATARTQVANKTITGDVDSDGNGGILQFTVGAGGVTGTIGANNALTKVEFNAGGNAVNLGGNAAATDFKFAAADDVTVGTITGNVNFANNAGILTAAGLITGDVDSTVGANGTLNLAAGSGVTGAIGATNGLIVVNATGAGVVLGDTINTATLNIKNGATVEAADNSAAAIA